MPFRKTLHREVEVAFSKHAQPVGFRVIKYTVLTVIVYFFWGNPFLWPVLIGVFVFSILLHLWYRHKTEGWTKSYGKWKYEQNKPAPDKDF